MLLVLLVLDDSCTLT